MAIGKPVPLNPSSVLGRKPEAVPAAKTVTEVSVERPRRRKEGKRSSAEYTQFNVFVPVALKREFEILCIRLGIDNSEGVERVVRAAVNGKVRLDDE
jgi:hypothetical protein